MRNESLDAETVEFLRILNLHLVEHEGARLGRSPSQAGGRPGAVLDRTDIDDARECPPRVHGHRGRSPTRLLPASSSETTAPVVPAPRKTGNTTTEQHLDPARLDHFLALTELPEQMHAPLRRLVEREASTRSSRTPRRPGAREHHEKITASSPRSGPLMPDTALVSRPLDVVLHVGTGKAGSSSIQKSSPGEPRPAVRTRAAYPESPGHTGTPAWASSPSRTRSS